MKKKVLASILVVCVVFGAGSALAQQVKRNDQERRAMPAGSQQMHRQDNRPDEGRAPGKAQQPNRPNFEEKMGIPGGRCVRFTPDMPKEIRAKVVEVAKLKIDLEEAMSDKPLNKAKAIEIHAMIQKVEAEIEAWRFEKMLDRINDFDTQIKLNKQYTPEPQGNTEEAE